MKKTLILLTGIMALILSSCKPATIADNSNASNSDLKPEIIATIFPQYDFARQIAKENAEISMLLKPGSESHSYEPTPKDIINIQNCDLFIYTGGESDNWIKEILSSVNSEDTHIINLTDICDLIEYEDEHNHDNEINHSYDEHVWTSPKNVKLISKAICEALCSIDSESESEYVANYNEYITQLDTLDNTLTEITANSQRNKLIFADRFPFAYLAKDYGLEYISAFPGCSEETEPSIKTVTSLIDTINREKIPTVFYIEFSNQKLADTIASETGAGKSLLHSCHNVTAEDFNSGVTYIDLMNENANTLKEALN